MVDRDVVNGALRSGPSRGLGRLSPRATNGHMGVDRDLTVFSAARRHRFTSGEFSSGNVSFSYRTTERDKAPAREVLTPILMGDPAPGRITDYDLPRKPGHINMTNEDRRCPHTGRLRTQSGIILMTFKEHAEQYGDDL